MIQFRKADVRIETKPKVEVGKIADALLVICKIMINI